MWCTTREFPPNACRGPLPQAYQLRSSQGRGHTDSLRVLTPEGLGVPRVYISSVMMSGDIHIIGPGTQFENDHLS